MNTIFILLMVLNASVEEGGTSTISQEFTSKEQCEIARKILSTSPIKKDFSRPYYVVSNSVCIKK